MGPSTHAVLVETVERYEQSGDAISARELSESLDVPEASLDRPLGTLCEFELLTVTEEGYRPTVTAQELLALDVNFDDVLVLDLVDE